MFWKGSREAETRLPRTSPAAKMASSASAGKRTVKQDELRRLMKSEKQRLSASRKRVESPFAKYNRLGQLSCALCGVPVKSELLWPTHVLGKQHKEKVALLKGPKGPGPGPAPPPPPPQPPAKRTGPEPEGSGAKRARAGGPQASAPAAPGLPVDFFDSGAKEAPPEAPRKASGLSLLPDYGDDDEDEEGEGEEEGGKSEAPAPAPAQEAAPSALPPDFFDQDAPAAPAVFHSGSIQKAEVQEKVVERRENTAEALPEGFFDDPEVDAKVRKVDAPKDQMDKEWDEFQKAMRQVNTVSEAIVAEEDEEGRLDRQIGEIDEQIECYRRVELLRDRQDILKSRLRAALTLRDRQRKEDESPDSDDEGELQDLLCQDWRVKGALL
ncbi:zinc finger protein 830 [Dromiciops gliroides]|uniref:zinc finger protein 830 n=1 Tax=Dromiciops gliroides TaxID=33562 RepID=UPI001CC63542|nr:zinc finger protein 830 [Dromiciops gliroides]